MADDTLIQRLLGRAAFCRDRGEVKTPELLEQAAAALRAGSFHPDTQRAIDNAVAQAVGRAVIRNR